MPILLYWIIAGVIGYLLIILITFLSNEPLPFNNWYKVVILSILFISFGVLTLAAVIVAGLTMLFIWCLSD